MTDARAARRNVVLLTVDSLRADYCYERVPTPETDALAGDGTRFEAAIAPGPATYESMPAVFTGIQPGPTHLLDDRSGARRGIGHCRVRCSNRPPFRRTTAERPVPGAQREVTSG